MMLAAHRRVLGFTLVELLVALFIFAVMSALGYTAINQAMQNRERVRSQQQRLAELQVAMRYLVQDFSQIAPRPVRDLVGAADEPSLRGDPRSQPLVAFTRGGVANPAGQQRPMLQRIEYALDEANLQRVTWPTLDRTQAVTPQRRRLLGGVRAIRLRYMDAARQWVEQWPPTNTPRTPNERLRMRPIAVEVTLELEDFGTVTRLIEVVG